MKKPELGKNYEITFYDHFSDENNSSKEATEHEPVVLKAYGKCIGMNKSYYILCWLYEKETSKNNDTMHILRKEVKSIKELH